MKLLLSHIPSKHNTFVHTVDKSMSTPKVMHITLMLNTLNESRDTNANLDTLFHFLSSILTKIYNL